MAENGQASLVSPHLNSGLFADYYLNTRVPKLPEWNDALFEAGKACFAQIKALRATIRPETLDEAQLEENYVQPLLHLLGQHYAVQGKIRYGEKGHRKPDYVFLASEAEAQAVTSRVYEPHEIMNWLAVGDAKRWGVKLDQASGKGDRSPSQQIDEYLRYSERPWGILTDGRYWRLYHRDSSKYNRYYAVDLESLLEHDNIEGFLYFFAFFRLEALTSGWLEKVLAGSEEFAQKLTDTLEGEVFDALELIAQGFLDYRRNQLKPDATTLRAIYEQSLVLLYRLLFIFYAESREILPLHQNDNYTSFRSLQSIKNEVMNTLRFRGNKNPTPGPSPFGVPMERGEKAGEGRGSLSADSGHIYTRLNDLFFAIDAGDAALDMPPYNGRLFSDMEHPFLAKNKVGDTYLIPALDKMARVDDNGKRVFVDYRDLEVRHLGSIYEKLLEYDLAIATEALIVRNNQYVPAGERTPPPAPPQSEYRLERGAKAGGSSGVPIREGGNTGGGERGEERTPPPAPPQSEYRLERGANSRPIRPGEVYLKTGSNERKVTGSYYTPDYIVRFIVEKTLEPLLTAITARHADLNEDGSYRVRETEAAALVNEVLALNVLDPATGSGHFVVDATAYMAEWLRALGIRPVDLGDEDELIYWKRQVASSCIYAVDINPLAVELAKLSMWLATLAKGKPLSFLDHHIRLGNSLVGTRMSAIEDAALSVKDEERLRRARAKARAKDTTTGQIALFSDADFNAGVQFAVQQMDAIEHTIANQVSDVKHQEELYADLTKRLSAWKQAADVWTARYFGLEITDEEWKYIREFSASGVLPPFVRVVTKQADELAKQHRFFHWELAFPEIFYDADGQPKANPGFDAVVGNPPYVRQERIQPIKPFLETHYEVYSGTADLFLYFYERGIGFLKPEYRLGYITSGTYMNSNSARPFRQYIHANTGLEWVANFGENQPFRGAEMVYPTMAIMHSGKAKETFRNLFMEGNVPYAQLAGAVEKGEWVDSLSEATGMEEWRFQPAELTRLFRKLVENNRTLGAKTEGEIYYGVKTGFNEAFIIDSETRKRLIEQDSHSTEIIKPLLRGQDLRPWYQAESGQFMILSYQGIDIDQYPAIKAHLEQYRSNLEPKPENWNGTWHGRAAGNYKWYELQTTTTASYRQMSDGIKICWPDISKLPRFSINDGSYFNNTVYMVGMDNYSLLAILQSRPIWFALSQLAQPLRLRAGLWQYRLFTQFTERLPIPELTAEQESSLAAIAEEVTGLAKQRYGMHEAMRRTIRGEFGGGAISTRVDLYRWWELADDQALSDQIRQQLGQEIPLRKRAEWRSFLAEQKAEHARLTGQIVALETRLNAIVYDAFGLDADERALIERTTKYPYGEV